MSTKIKLSKPITAHGQEVDEIELREPGVEDIGDMGYPFLVVQSDDDTQAIEMRPKVVQKYICVLAGLNMAAVKSMAISDFMACQRAVMGFFKQGGSADQ